MNRTITSVIRCWLVSVSCLLALCSTVFAVDPPKALPTAIVAPPTSPTIDGPSTLSLCVGGTERGIEFSCPVSTTASYSGPESRTASGSNGFLVIYFVNPGVESYTFTCTNAAQESSSTEFTIYGIDAPSEPVITSNPASGTVEVNASFSLTATCPTGSTAIWADDPMAGAIRTVVAPSSPQDLFYYVSCQAAEGGCGSNEIEVVIQVLPAPIRPTVSPTPNLTACLGTPLSVTASCPTAFVPQITPAGGSALLQSTYGVDGSVAGVFSYTVDCVPDGSARLAGLLIESVTGTLLIEALPTAPTVTGNPASLTTTEGTAVTLTASCLTGTPEWTDGTKGSVLVSPSASGFYNYSAICVSAAGCRSTETPVTATIDLPENPVPTVDLALPKVDVSRRTPAPGERVRYVTHVLNEDSNPSTNIHIAVQLPAGSGYTTDNSPTTDPSSTTWTMTPTTPGTTFDPGTGRVLLHVDDLAPGERRLLYFYATVPPTPTTSTASNANKYYTYWQIMSADTKDPDSPHGNGFCNGEDDTQSIDTRINVPTNAGADVELFGNMSVSNPTPAQNEVVTIRVGIKNNLGPQVATNVIARATLPVGLSYVSSSTPGVSYNTESRELTFTAGSIAANATAQFVFTASVTAPENTALRMQAEIKSADQFDHDSVFDNALCNNYDDDTDEIRLTVRGVLAPPTENPPVTPGSPLTLITPLYDCATGQITFRTSGGSGSPITFTAIGVQRSSATNPTGVIEAGVRLDPNSSGIITIGALQDGLMAQPLSFNFRQFCAQNPDPVSPPSSTTTAPPSGTGVAPTSLTLLAPLYNCTTRQVTFQTAGGSGSPLLYSIVFVTVPSGNPVQFIDAAIVNDPNNSTVILRVQQDGVTLNRTFDFRAFCSGTPPSNGAPVPPAVGPQSATVGVPFTFVVPAFTDPNGDALTYTATGLPANGLSFNAGTRTISGTPSQSGVIGLTISATDPGNLSSSVSFAVLISGTATTPVSPTQPAPLALIAPTYDCATGAFTFNTTGGTGQPIQYRAVGITDWSTVAGPYTVRPFADAQPFALQARYVGNPASEVSYSWDFKAVCSGGAAGRVASAETSGSLDVTVLGNPTSADAVQIVVRGAAGGSLRLRVADATGQLVSEQLIEQAGATESRRVQLGRSVGMYFVQVSTPGGQKTVKVVRQ